ncbi:MAG: thermonuclease family protein [Chromatiales bacterium]|nr:MAG: thermonuclease family protein [Chromatiales bacterium]
MTPAPERLAAIRSSFLPEMFVCALAVCAGNSAAASDEAANEFVLRAALGRVVDGDTLTVMLDSGPITVRMHGIDTPERNQANGKTATKLLRTLVEGEALEIEPIEQRDRYDRMVAKVFVRGEDVNARMVSSGYAWAYRQYLRREPADEAYCRLEAEARDEGRGLWAAARARPEPPWVFRARKDGREVAAIDYREETAEKCLAAIGQAAVGSSSACPIKGNINARGEKIYHVPGSSSYTATRIDAGKGERWFCSVEEAEQAGWRAPRGPR